jgi:hypothetical protein
MTTRRVRRLLIQGLLLLALLVMIGVACRPTQQEPPALTPIVTTTAPTVVVTTPDETGATATTPATATAPATSTAEPPAETATPPATTAATSIGTIPAGVAYVMAVADVNLRSGPGTGYSVTGWMTPGQIARVSAASSDRAWWQLDCPSSTVAQCWVTAASAYTKPQPDAARIQFAPGATVQTVTGTMSGDDQVHYVFTAGAGQTMAIDVAAPGDSVLFHLQGLRDGQVYKHMLSGELSWQGMSPQAQDYLLALNASGASATYTLRVAVGGSLPPATSEPGGEAPGGPLYPIIDAESGYLLGGTQNGVWVNAATYAGYLQDTERDYDLFTLAGRQGNVTGSRPVTPAGVCTQPVVSFQPAGNRAGAVALAVRWDAAPRLAQSLPVDTAEYLEAVTALLQEQGLANPEINIDSILRVDLEGDGVDEVLITASRLAAGTSAPPVAAGDYALLVLRKVVDGAVTTVPIVLDVYATANDLAYPFRYRVLGLLDLDGDGQLEIIVEAERYEGRRVFVYATAGARVQQVLQAGCVQ